MDYTDTLTKQFKVEPFSDFDKSILISGPDDLELAVDYDDVNHYVIQRLLPHVVRALNGIPPADIEDAIQMGNADYARANPDNIDY